MPVRKKSYVLGQAYAIVKADTEAKKGWRGAMRMGSNPFQGQLYLIENDDPWELVGAKDTGDGKTFDVIPNVANLHFGIEKSHAETIGERVQLRLKDSV